MTTIAPRIYQTRVHEAVMKYIWEVKCARVLALEPTGVGKSVQIAMLIEDILRYAPDARIVMLTHSKDLVEQNYEKLVSICKCDVGLWSAGLGKTDYHAQVVYAGIQTVSRNPHLLGRRDIVIVDEAHRVSPDNTTEYHVVDQYLRTMNPMVSWIGYTATDYRLGQGLLTDQWYNKKIGDYVPSFWREVAIDLTSTEEFNWFFNEGYLKRLVPRPTVNEIDVSGFRKREGEYLSSDVEKEVNKQSKIESICDEICEMGFDRRTWLVFAAGNKNAELICEEMLKRGVSAVAVTEKTPKKIRDKAVADYKSGKLRCLINNNIYTTGFDYNAIDLIAVVRVTASTQLWVQMLGRGTRPVYAHGFDLTTRDGRLMAISASGIHNCLVLDFAGNSKRLGAINAPVKPRPKGSKAGSAAPTKVCPACGVINPSIVRICEFCGAEFEVKDKLTATASTTALIKERAHIPDKRKLHVTSVRFSVRGFNYSQANVSTRIEATYRCGKNGAYTEYLSFAGAKSSKRIKAWWQAFGGTGTPPEDNASFMAIHTTINQPVLIEVYMNPPKKTKPEITYYGFEDTSAFDAELDYADNSE